jgi:serine-type D-Ala-D-Ala carboxypeptidase (penicillin-binding protein 5/6)
MLFLPFLICVISSWGSTACCETTFHPGISIPMTTEAPYALLLDLSTHTVLFEKNANERIHPSSMTKVALLYLLFEALKNKDMSLTDTVCVSQNAQKKEGTCMYLRAGQMVDYENLIKGIVTGSANDACTAVAESYSGSEELCAQLLSDKMKSLGAKNTNFVNTSGLPDKNHYSTCWDLARISIATIENFPEEYKKYYSIPSFTFQKVKMVNRNMLLKKNFADGMKTGKTDAGKCGMIASSERNGRRLLLVVNGLPTEEKRTIECVRLLNWGFQFFDAVFLYKKNQTVFQIPVWNQKPIEAVAADDIFLSAPRRLKSKMTLKVRYYHPIVPPIKKGQKIGALIISIPQYPDLEYPLVAKENVEDQGFFRSVFQLFFS